MIGASFEKPYGKRTYNPDVQMPLPSAFSTILGLGHFPRWHSTFQVKNRSHPEGQATM